MRSKGTIAWTWVPDPRSLPGLLNPQPSARLAVDTESDSYHHYGQRLCLVQLASGNAVCLLDTLEHRAWLELEAWLADPQIEKVFHGADYDLRVLDRDLGIRVTRLFDTMIAARFLGYRRYGLDALLEELLGVRTDKRHQLADWTRRPLPERLQAYAAGDVAYLPALAEHLQSSLEQKGRLHWAQEEFKRLEAVQWEPTEGTEGTRLKGGGRLTPRQRAVAQAVVRLRDAVAQERDRPPTRVLPDRAVVAVSRALPVTLSELRRIDALPEGWRRGGLARRLVEAVAMGREGPAVPAGPRPIRPDAPPKALVATLRRARDRRAKELGLEPSFLLSRAQLEAVARAVAQDRDPRSLEEIRNWQWEAMDNDWIPSGM